LSSAAEDEGAVLVAFWRATTSAIPILAVLLPASGFLIRLIASSFDPWIPSELAGQVPPTELIATGAFALSGAVIGAFPYYVVFAWRSPRAVYWAPFDAFADLWRMLGPNETRRNQAIAALRRLRSPWSWHRLSSAIRRRLGRLVAHFAGPRLLRRIVTTIVRALLRLVVIGSAILLGVI